VMQAAKATAEANTRTFFMTTSPLKVIPYLV
jgi:hypothetical protein